MRRLVAVLVLVALAPACANRAGGDLAVRDPRAPEEAAAVLERDSVQNDPRSAARIVPDFERKQASGLEKAVGVVLVIALSLAAAAGLAYFSYVVMPDLVD